MLNVRVDLSLVIMFRTRTVMVCGGIEAIALQRRRTLLE